MPWPGGESSATSSVSHQAKSKFMEETVICHSKPASLSSTESSDGGSSRRTENLVLDQIHDDKFCAPDYHIYDIIYHERRGGSAIESSILSHENLGTKPSNSDSDSNTDKLISNALSSSAIKAADFGKCSRKGHDKPSDLDGCCKVDVATDNVDEDNSYGGKEKSEEDGENNELLGGLFAFSEEG